MMEFTKEKICQYLANKDYPKNPHFNLRKIIKLKNAESNLMQENWYINYYKNKNKHLIITDFSDYTFSNHDDDYKLGDYLFCLLNKEDINLLIDIFGEAARYCHATQNAEDFEFYNKVFAESPKKPDWDLIRCIEENEISNKKVRQKLYESLLSDGLVTREKKGEVILNEDCYILPTREQHIIEDIYKTNQPNNSYCTLDYVLNLPLESYIDQRKINEIEELNIINEVRCVIIDALYRDELPIYKGVGNLRRRIEFKKPIDYAKIFVLKAELEIFFSSRFNLSLAIGHDDTRNNEATEITSTRPLKPNVGDETGNKRDSQLHQLFWRVYQHLTVEGTKKVKAQMVWNELQYRHVNHDTDKIIQEIDVAQILWSSCYDNEQKFQRGSFDKTLSELKKKNKY